jgi:glycosyltransferase involved in cell wall biosynthesis
MSTTLIIIPAYNEADSIGAVLAELATETPEHDVVVISDGSTDRTVDVVRAAGCPVLELPYNIGIGGALRTGFAYAVRNGYERAVQFDADGQHDPLQVQPLLARLDEGADLVVGSRFADGGAVTYAVGRIRRVAMRLLSKLVQLLVGRRFTDTSSGFRAFSRPLLQFFAKTYPVEYMDSVEALVLASNAGFEIAEVGVNMRGRTGGAPSTRRVKLVYYYVRLVIVLLASATGERRRASRHSDRHPVPAKGARA